MTTIDTSIPRARYAASGLIYLAITSVGWGLNWPVTKYLIGEVPVLTMRGSTGLVGAALLATLAVANRQSLAVPSALWPRLLTAALLNVTGWMVLMGLGLLWLPASEAALIAYTMPVWASLLAWPVLGERPTLMRALALIAAFAGLAAIMGAIGALGFALGTVLAKRRPLDLPPLSAAAWQIGLGCLPIAIVGNLIETTHWAAITPKGWALLSYATVIQFCVAYVAWFAALARLPASVAAIGTMAVPVIGVIASAIALGEPLGPGQIAALALTLGAVVLATRR